MGELAQVCEGLAGCDDGAGLPVTVRRKAAEEIALVADGGHSTRLTDIRKTGANPGAPDWPFSPRSLIYRLRALRVAALRIGGWSRGAVLHVQYGDAEDCRMHGLGAGYAVAQRMMEIQERRRYLTGGGLTPLSPGVTWAGHAR